MEQKQDDGSTAAAEGEEEPQHSSFGVETAAAAAAAAKPVPEDDEDIYEIDENGDIMLDEAGNPIRLPPPPDPLPLYRKLTASHPVVLGKSKSRKERIAKDLTSPDLVYGEVTFELMQAVFNELKRMGGVLHRRSGVFVDLGAGLGKPVFSAALLHSFKKCVGVEVLQTLHESSEEMNEIFNKRCRPLLNHPPKIKLLLGDVAEVPWWKSSTVVFINMTTFTEQLIEVIKDRAATMKRGTVCITVTKQLHSKAWEVVHTSEQELNWGPSHVYIHTKVL